MKGEIIIKQKGEDGKMAITFTSRLAHLHLNVSEIKVSNRKRVLFQSEIVSGEYHLEISDRAVHIYLAEKAVIKFIPING